MANVPHLTQTSYVWSIATSASDLTLRTNKFSSLRFSSSWSSMLFVINKIHCSMAGCAVNCTVDRRSCSQCSCIRSSSQISLENRDFAYPTCIQRPLRGRGVPSVYCRNVSYGKTRMVWLADGEKILKICLFVSTEYTNVTDRQTDRQTDGRTPHEGIGRSCIASRGKNKS